jgi:hypothetical protein
MPRSHQRGWSFVRELALVALWGVLCCIGAAHSASLDEDSGLEYGVKAAFLFKFPAYVQWPEAAFSAADAPFVIGVTGSEPMMQELQQISSGRTINGRPVQLRRMKPGDSSAGVHMLFVGRGEGARLPQVLRAAHQRPVLTVTESEGALAQGAIINFVIVDGRVRFDISVPSALAGGITLSSRLLAVAQHVRTP